jgi:anti-anti-sigma factor
MEATKPTAAVTHEADHSTVRIGGYISTDAADPLETAFQQTSDALKILVVFDEKCFINSTGLAILFELILPLKDEGTDVRIVHPSQHFRKVFDIVGLSKDVPVFAAEDRALGN